MEKKESGSKIINVEVENMGLLKTYSLQELLVHNLLVAGIPRTRARKAKAVSCCMGNQMGIELSINKIDNQMSLVATDFISI